MKPKLLLLLILTLSLFLVASCASSDKNDGSIPEGNYLWSDKTDLTIYFTKDFSEEDVINIRQYAASVTGINPETRLTDASKKSDTSHALIIGQSGDEASRRAYRLLERLIVGDAEMSGYVIYGYNGSVALAYTDVYVVNDLIEKFYDLFNSTVTYFTNGVIFYEADETTELIKRERDEQWDIRFAELGAKLPAETVSYLRAIYNKYYDNALYTWLANLYDPDAGGFYYSNSGRNTEGFLPDVESTVQALVFLNQSGLLQKYGNDYKNALPLETRRQMIKFVQKMQSPEDGFFYHPQWGEYISISRRGRDLGWATTLLVSLGAKPLYDTPNGYSGSLGAPGQNTLSPTASLSGQLRSSIATGVSKVVATAATPAHLKSESAFLEYLRGLNFKTDSYVVGNDVNAQKGQIQAAGLEQVFIDYVNSIQRSDNGLWESEVTYNSVNGLMKIAATVASFGGSLRYINQAFESTVKIALMTDPAPTNVCSIYNMWSIMANLIAMEAAAGNTDNAAGLRKIAIDNSAELIRITYEKMAPFKKDDGGFSYGVNYTSSTSQGASVSVLYTPESDVNSTTIMTNSILGSIYSTFGVSFIPLYYEEDGEYFLNTLNSLGTIIKDSGDGMIRETVASFTSEEIDTQFVKSHYFSSENKQVSVSTPPEDLVEPDPNYIPITRFSVVNDPVDEKNKVLKVECDQNSEIANGATILTPSLSTYEGHCHIFESRIYYDYIAKGDPTQIFFEDSQGKDLVAFRLNYNSETGKISIIQHNKDGSGRDTVKGITLPYKEWFTLRIEVYQTGVAETTMARISVGIGDEEPVCLAEINAYCQLALTKAITKVNVAHQRTTTSVAYFDNISYKKTEDKFVPTFITKDYMELPNTPADFESGAIISGNVLSYDEKDHMIGSTEASYDGSSISYSVTEDPASAANKVLKVATNGQGTLSVRTEAAITNEDAAGNVYVFETRIYALPSSVKVHPTQIGFVDSTGKEHVKFIFTLNNSNGTISLMDHNSNSGNKWATLVTLSPNTWGNIRLEYYKSETASENYVKLYASEGDDPLKLVYIYSNAVEYASENPLVSVYLNHQTSTSATIYYDDVSFRRVDKKYVYETPEELVPSNPIVPENPGIVNGTFTFETVPVGSTSFSTSNYGWSMGADSGYTKEVVEDTVYGETSRVYKLDPGKLNNDLKIYATPVKVTADAATAYKMALDLKILPDSSASDCSHELLFYSSTAVFQIGMKQKSNGIEFWNKANGDEKYFAAGTDYKNVSFLFVGDKGELTAILCLDGAYAAAFTTPITETEFAFTEMTHFRIRAKSTDNTLFIDNIYVGFTDETVPEASETPEAPIIPDTPGTSEGTDTEEEPGEGSIYDKDGWIK
ncbi:MAG: hypothetical protein J6B48_08435 [Clostridia bacterium]|nr:hypothetical protein [Clostridia bacterium]